MKITRTETHDRLLHFQNQANLIAKGCEDCIASRPKEFGNHPFYIFSHKREIALDERIGLFNDDLRSSILNPSYVRQYSTLEQVPTARIIWSPRLTKPKAQENSMLFKAYPPGDNIKVIWMIPQKELWDQFSKGNMLENKIIVDSIHDFQFDRQKLEHIEDDDLPEEQVKRIYMEINKNGKKRKSKPDPISWDFKI